MVVLAVAHSYRKDVVGNRRGFDSAKRKAQHASRVSLQDQLSGSSPLLIVVSWVGIVSSSALWLTRLLSNFPRSFLFTFGDVRHFS